jgi:hypothetical protein
MAWDIATSWHTGDINTRVTNCCNVITDAGTLKIIAIATCGGLLGIALAVAATDAALLVALPGSFVRVNAWNWTVGNTLYAGETAGAMQATIPTGADAIIRVVGFAIDADTIFFNPSSDQSSTVA